jgi:hypothetical protein|tara:strand:- start:570 stop:1016 length:447 start_codon:yes stop_codon:yes gene_type:complete
MAKQKKIHSEQGMENESFNEAANLLMRLLMGWDGSNSVALKVNANGELVIAGGGATTPTIYNVTVASANSEESQALSANTKQFFVKLRGRSSSLRMAFVTGGADASTGTFITIPANGFLSPAGLDFSSKTLYFETSGASQVIEIMEFS